MGVKTNAIRGTEWRMIDGYFWPYRINEEAQIQRLVKPGVWRDVAPFLKRRPGTVYGQLCVHMKTADGVRKNVFVKSLMINAFFGGRKPGEMYGHKNGMTSDCSRYNLFPTNARDVGQRAGGSGRKNVEKIDRNGNVVALYSSVSEAARADFMSRKAVYMRCTNKIEGDPFKLTGYSYRYEK